MADDFDYCAEAVRRHDPDRFFAALFAPAAARRHLMALTAFYYELAHAAAAAHEPMLREIRLMWWREALAEARNGSLRDHAVLRALGETLKAYDLSDALFEPILTARAAGPAAMPNADFADATVGALMRAWLVVLGVSAETRDAAIAYGLAGRAGEDEMVRQHYRAARLAGCSKAALPALMPAALVPLYLKHRDPPLWRKQVALLMAALRGRI